MKLSVIIPVYNEESTISEILERVAGVPVEKEIIVVDDGSKDRTRDRLNKTAQELRKKGHDIKIVSHSENKGKGAAIRTGLKLVSGEVVIIQDGDLEYVPDEYPKIMAPILEGKAEVVYGSRFSGRRNRFTLHFFANRFLTIMTNLLYGSGLSDMETCYKVFLRNAVRPEEIKSSRFEVEPELTVIFLKKGYRIWEVPISYAPRTRFQGKKIGWKDGFETGWFILKSRLGF
ncbi:MAG: glycosyltransferase family 2 protein [Candidatus Ratteibacteria bacterium]|jgi:glycosyltransferase involved in cell wall biosynthesis